MLIKNSDSSINHRQKLLRKNSNYSRLESTPCTLRTTSSSSTESSSPVEHPVTSAASEPYLATKAAPSEAATAAEPPLVVKKTGQTSTQTLPTRYEDRTAAAEELPTPQEDWAAAVNELPARHEDSSAEEANINQTPLSKRISLNGRKRRASLLPKLTRSNSRSRSSSKLPKPTRLSSGGSPDNRARSRSRRADQPNIFRK